MATYVPFLLLAAALGCGLVGGIFFAFSTFIMKALASRPPAQGAAAMQAINITVINPLFLVLFLGTALVSAALAVVALLGVGGGGGRLPLAPVMIGFFAYVVGSFLVTMVFNVPLNTRLAKLGLVAISQEAEWRRYCRVWTAWNHVRTLASVVAAVAFMVALEG
jgi:uncharacterized membrane protein